MGKYRQQRRGEGDGKLKENKSTWGTGGKSRRILWGILEVKEKSRGEHVEDREQRSKGGL